MKPRAARSKRDMKFIIQKILLMLGALLLTELSGCTGQSTNPATPSGGAAAGKYVLVQGNGQALPIAAGSTVGNCLRFVDSGTLFLNADGDYSFLLQTRAVCHSPDTNTVSDTALEKGMWSVNGSSLTLKRSGGSALNESNTTLANGSITTTVQYEWAGQLPPITLVLQKQ